MPARAPSIADQPQLPNELYRDIIESLHYLRDRRTLLRLALVSKAWCGESQRVLFRTVCDDSMNLDKRGSLIHTHTLFLKAIILNPTRLGPYVQTYKQRELICHPFLAARSNFGPLGTARSHLWDTTAEALPALVNLKHLFVVPLYNDPRTPRAFLLEGCTFKLKSLRWGFETYNPSSTELLVNFLRTQHELTDLEVGFLPSRQDLSWLPGDVCLNLISASCRLDSAAHMDLRETAIGLTTWSPWYPSLPVPQEQLSALRRIKYLSLFVHRDLISNFGTIELDAVLLEIASWDVPTIASFPRLPKLRILALTQAQRDEAPSMLLRNSRVMDAKAESNLQMQVAIESFRQCPNLEYIVIEDIVRGEGPRRYRKLFISGDRARSDTVPDIQSEDFPVEHELGNPWWTAYYSVQ